MQTDTDGGRYALEEAEKTYRALGAAWADYTRELGRTKGGPALLGLEAALRAHCRAMGRLFAGVPRG